MAVDYDSIGAVERSRVRARKKDSDELTRLRSLTRELVEALTDVLGDTPDMQLVANSEGRVFQCRHCGRTYPSNDIPASSLECSDDCPGHIGRAVLAKAKEV